MTMSVIKKLIQIFQSHYQLKEYIDTGVDATSHGLENDANFVNIITSIVFFHMLNKTNLTHVARFEEGYEMVEANLMKIEGLDLTDGDLYNYSILVTRILDIIFHKLKSVLKRIYGILSSSSSSENTAYRYGITQNIAYIVFLLFARTDIMPSELKDYIAKNLDIKEASESVLVKRCGTVLQKGLISRVYGVCNVNLKEELSGTKSGGIKLPSPTLYPYLSLDTVIGVQVLLGVIMNLRNNRNSNAQEVPLQENKYFKQLKSKSPNVSDIKIEHGKFASDLLSDLHTSSDD